jgi:hypothetical protein
MENSELIPDIIIKSFKQTVNMDNEIQQRNNKYLKKPDICDVIISINENRRIWFPQTTDYEENSALSNRTRSNKHMKRRPSKSKFIRSPLKRTDFNKKHMLNEKQNSFFSNYGSGEDSANNNNAYNNDHIVNEENMLINGCNSTYDYLNHTHEYHLHKSNDSVMNETIIHNKNNDKKINNTDNVFDSII